MDSTTEDQRIDFSSAEDINSLFAGCGGSGYVTQIDTGPFSGTCVRRNWENVSTLSLALTTAAFARQIRFPGYFVLGSLLSEAPAKINGLDLGSNNFFMVMPGSSFYITTTGSVAFQVALISESGVTTELTKTCCAMRKSISDVAVISPSAEEQIERIKNWCLQWLSSPHSMDRKIPNKLSRQVNEVLYSMLQPIGENMTIDTDRDQNGNIKASQHGILKLIDCFYQRPESPLFTAEMSAISGLNRRSLFHHFKNFTGYSPYQFFRYIRLQAVRQALLTKADRVTKLAAKFNFRHHGELSRFYKNTYGELPSETRLKTLSMNSGPSQSSNRGVRNRWVDDK